MLSDGEFEGTVVRKLRSLDELLSQLRRAADVLGNAQLSKRFQDCRDNIRRGIVFTNSLYLVD